MTEAHFLKAQRIVVKVGSALLIDSDGQINQLWLEQLIKDIMALKSQGKQILIVSSGSIALGKRSLGKPVKALQLPEKQASAAIGQIKLVEAYQSAFMPYAQTIAQILLTLSDSENRKAYLNARNTLETLLVNDVIPLINENDTIATAEIRYGDNDRLAARVAQMVQADMLVLLSDIDGLYTANPVLDPQAEHIPVIESVNQHVQKMAGESASNVGSGGMKTKLAAAKLATENGASMIICQGRVAYPLTRIQHSDRYTLFKPVTTPQNARKRWIKHHLNNAGSLTIDDGAYQALLNGKSLLAVGITHVEGHFNKGDVVTLKDRHHQGIGVGVTRYAALDIARIQGLRSQEISNVLKYCSGQPVIHRNDLVIEKEKPNTK